MHKKRTGWLFQNIDHWPTYIFPLISEKDVLALHLPITLGAGEWLYRFSDTTEQFYVFFTLLCAYAIYLFKVAFRNKTEGVFTKIAMAFIYGIELSLFTLITLKETGGLVSPNSFTDYYTWYILLLQIAMIVRANALLVTAMWMVGTYSKGNIKMLNSLEKRVHNLQVSRIQLWVMCFLSMGFYTYFHFLSDPPQPIGISVLQSYFFTSTIVAVIKR